MPPCPPPLWCRHCNSPFSTQESKWAPVWPGEGNRLYVQRIGDPQSLVKRRWPPLTRCTEKCPPPSHPIYLFILLKLIKLSFQNNSPCFHYSVLSLVQPSLMAFISKLKFNPKSANTEKGNISTWFEYSHKSSSNISWSKVSATRVVD